MTKPNVRKIMKSIGNTLSKRSPEILTGIGIAGMVTTTILAVKATPKAMEIKKSNEELKGEKLTKIEVVKVAWKPYIPAAITGVVSTACLVGASSVNLRRNAVLATAYKLSENALTEYREKVVETIGKKKEKDIRNSIDKDRIEKNPVGRNEVFITGRGETLCYDHTSGRYFKSDIDKIKKAVNEVNRKMLSETYISLNEFYDELGLSGISIGEKMGWNTDMGLIELHFSSQLDENGTPCLVIDYEIPPKYDFDRFL